MRTLISEWKYYSRATKGFIVGMFSFIALQIILAIFDYTFGTDTSWFFPELIGVYFSPILLLIAGILGAAIGFLMDKRNKKAKSKNKST